MWENLKRASKFMFLLKTSIALVGEVQFSMSKHTICRKGKEGHVKWRRPK